MGANIADAGRFAYWMRERADTIAIPGEDEFCPDCFAGVESSEHFEKCERPAREREETTP